MCSLGSKVAGRHESLGAELVLKIERPVLDVRRLEIWIDAGNILERVADGRRSRQGIIKCRGVNNYLLLKRRISRNQIRFIETERHLVVIEAIPGPDRSRAFLKWVPGNSYSWREVIGGRRNRLAERRCSGARNSHLTIYGDSVQRIARTGYAVTISCHLESLTRTISKGIKAGHAAIAIPRLTKARKAHSVRKSDVTFDAPLVLGKCFNISRKKISGQVELVLRESLKIAEQKICPKLIRCACPGGSCRTGRHSTVPSLIEAAERIFMLSNPGKIETILGCVCAEDFRERRKRRFVIREIAVWSKRAQSCKAVSGDIRNSASGVGEWERRRSCNDVRRICLVDKANYLARNITERVRGTELQDHRRGRHPSRATYMCTPRRAGLCSSDERSYRTSVKKTTRLNRRDRVVFKSVIHRELVIESMIDSYELLSEIEDAARRKVKGANR